MLGIGAMIASPRCGSHVGPACFAFFPAHAREPLKCTHTPLLATRAPHLKNEIHSRRWVPHSHARPSQYTPSSLTGTGVTFNSAVNQFEIECSSDRRMLATPDEDAHALDPLTLSASPGPEVEAALPPCQSTNPEAAEMTVDVALAFLAKRASSNPQLLDRVADQLFGQPALA